MHVRLVRVPRFHTSLLGCYPRAALQPQPHVRLVRVPPSHRSLLGCYPRAALQLQPILVFLKILQDNVVVVDLLLGMIP